VGDGLRDEVRIVGDRLVHDGALLRSPSVAADLGAASDGAHDITLR